MNIKLLKKNPEKDYVNYNVFCRNQTENFPQYGIDFIEGSKEAYRQGTEGVVQEWKLYVSDWGIPWKILPLK